MTFEDREQESLMEKKLRCVDLLLGCPLNRNAAGCPFQALRQEEVVARVNWLKSLDEARITALLASHKACSSSRFSPGDSARH